MAMDIDAQEAREYARQQLIERAVCEADRIILDATKGSDKQKNRVTAAAAFALFATAIEPLDIHLFDPSVGLIVREVVAEVRRIISEYPEGSEAVRNGLLFRIAEKFIGKVGIIFNSVLMRWDLENPAIPEEQP